MTWWILALILFPGHADPISEGAYLVKIAGCADCHSPKPDSPFSGRLGIETDFGTFYTPNITSDRKAGIGNWSEEQFRRALHEGVAPSGSRYYPVFPYASYTFITDEDLKKMWAYLRSVPPIEIKNRLHQISYPYNQRWALRFWQNFFFEQGPNEPDSTQSPEWNRGYYLANALAHCAECHTPRSSVTGALIDSQWMAGSGVPINGLVAPNITRDRVSGLGLWTEEDWELFLLTGRNPMGKYPRAEMAQVINNTSALTAEDRRALVQYLMSLEAVRTGDGVP